MTLLASRPVGQQLSKYEAMFVTLARTYVQKYPHASFVFRFDRAVREEVGEGPRAAEIAFTDSAATWQDILTRGSAPWARPIAPAISTVRAKTSRNSWN